MIDKLARIDTKIAASMEEVEAANRASVMRHALGIIETHESRPPEAALNTVPPIVKAEGQLVDLGQHRRLKEARLEVAEAHENPPRPSSAEDMPRAA